MRIAYVQTNFHPNNAGIVSGLAARGHELLPIVQYPPGSKSADTSLAMDPVVVPYRSASLRRHPNDRKRLDRRGLPELRLLFRTLRDFHPDVVIVRGTRAVSLVAVQMARALGATPVLLWDKPLTARKRPLLALLGPLVLPRRKIHTGYFGTIGGLVRLGGLIGPSLLSTYPVASAQPKRNGTVPADDRVRLVAVGSLDNRVKRWDWIIDALAAEGIADRVEVTFLGLGSESSHYVAAVRAREAELGVRPSTFLFDLPHPEVLRMLPTFDVLVHPALKGLADAVIAEAMASGVPPLCSERCGTHICFVDGESGRVFRSDSKQDFAAKLAELVLDAELRGRMGEAAHDRARRLLSPAAWAERFESLVERWPPKGPVSA